MNNTVKKILCAAFALSPYAAFASHETNDDAEPDHRLTIAQAEADAVLRGTVLDYTSMRSPLVKGVMTRQEVGSSEKISFEVVGRDDLHLKLADPVGFYKLSLEIARRFDEPQIIFRTFSYAEDYPADLPSITRLVLDPPDAEFPVIRSIEFADIKLGNELLSGDIGEVPADERTYELLLRAERALVHPLYGHCMVSDCLLESEKDGRVTDVGDKRIVNSEVKQRILKTRRDVAQPDECPYECPSSQPVKECTESFQFAFAMTLPKSDLNKSTVEVTYVSPIFTTCECLP
jgi:hypothetical protein